MWLLLGAEKRILLFRENTDEGLGEGLRLLSTLFGERGTLLEEEVCAQPKECRVPEY